MLCVCIVTLNRALYSSGTLSLDSPSRPYCRQLFAVLFVLLLLLSTCPSRFPFFMAYAASFAWRARVFASSSWCNSIPNLSFLLSIHYHRSHFCSINKSVFGHYSFFLFPCTRLRVSLPPSRIYCMYVVRDKGLCIALGRTTSIRNWNVCMLMCLVDDCLCKNNGLMWWHKQYIIE